MKNVKDLLWVERYRPRSIEDCILPDEIKKPFLEMVKSKEIQNLMLCGDAGVGKTTVARALCEETQSDYIFINASESGNIDTLRIKIRNFASTVSLTGGKKVIILDEADHLNPQSTQPALRGFIEEFSKNCRFILTCNYANKIIEPLHSRCSVVQFRIPSKQKPELAKKLLTKIKAILDENAITYDDKTLVQLIMRYFPDFRKIIGQLQMYSVSGSIDSGILSRDTELEINVLFDSMKKKNYTDVRKWVASHTDVDSSLIFRKIYDRLTEHVDKSSIPAIILILGEYQYKIAFSADPEICLAACMAEIMMNATFIQ